MTMRETALSFACAGERLLGILAEPEGQANITGVLVIVGGPQYRIGSHRQFALLTRALARAGYPAMRFDYRGMGDSSGESPGYDAVDPDVAAAIDAMQSACPAVQKVVLWGLCDGGSAALLYALRQQDSRIAGLILANPWVHTEQAEAHAIVHSYYRQRLLDAGFWHKLIKGGINPVRKLREFGRHWRDARAGEREGDKGGSMRNALDQVRLPLLLLLCERDATAQRFLAYLELNRCPLLRESHVQRVDFAEADHTFSRAEWRAEVENVTIGWLSKHGI